MAGNLHVIPALDDLAVGSDQIRRPRDAHELAAVQRLLLPDAVLLGNRVVRVREQREREAVLGGELRLALLVEDADAEDHRLAAFVGRQLRLEVTRLLGAAWGVILRIEIENDRPSEVVGQLMRVAVLVLQRKRGRLLAWCDGVGGHFSRTVSTDDCTGKLSSRNDPRPLFPRRDRLARALLFI